MRSKKVPETLWGLENRKVAINGGVGASGWAYDMNRECADSGS